jgi:hypothetical protein
MTTTQALAPSPRPQAPPSADDETPAAGVRGRRILYVTHRFPYPPSDGARVRAFHAIRHLARHNAVTVAAPLRDGEAARLAELEAHGVRVEALEIGRLAGLARTCLSAGLGRSASRGYFDQPALRRRLRELARAQAFDLAVVHCSAVAPYVADLPIAFKVLDYVDVDSAKWLDYRPFARGPKRLLYALEGRSLGRLERAMARRFDLCLSTTDFEDRTLQALAASSPGRPVASAVVRNGVDLDYFHPGCEAYDPDRICFLGRMDYFPNEQAMVRFCDEVLPRLQAARPGLGLSIVGANPTPRVRALAELPGVVVTGRVADVRPYVRRAAATVAPLLIARGTQNKILESMAMGVPVVASDLAARGVQATPGEHLLSAGTPEDMARAVLSVLQDPRERARLAIAARALIERDYSWASTLAAFDAALAGLHARDADG